MKLVRVLSILLLLFVVPAMVFAGGGREEQVQLEEGQILVRFLVPRWASTGDVRIERQVAFQSVIDSFHAANPNVRVQEVISSASNYDVDVANQISEGTVEVVWINNPFYPTLQREGRFANLEPHLSAADREDFFGWTFDALKSVNGELGGLWHNTDVRLFFYRSDLIPNPPTTIEDFIPMARRIRQNNPGVAPYFLSLGHTDAVIHAYGLFHSLGGRMVDDTGRPIVLEGENRQRWARVFQTYKQMMDDGLIPESAAIAREGGVVPLLLAGQVAAFVGNSNFGVREIEPKLPADEAALWRATPVLGLRGAPAGVGVSGGWVISARKIDDNPRLQQAAIDFALHATNFSAQRNTNKAGGWTPTRNSVFTSDPFFSEDRFMAATAVALETSVVRPLVPIGPVVAQALADALGSYLTSGRSLDVILDEANRTILAEYGRM